MFFLRMDSFSSTFIIVKSKLRANLANSLAQIIKKYKLYKNYMYLLLDVSSVNTFIQ